MPSVRKKAGKQAKRAKAAVPFSAADLQKITKANPYLQRLIEDADLRENVRTAIESSKAAYSRLSNGKAPHRALLEDKKLQNELRQAAEALRDAADSLTESPKKYKAKKKGGRFGRRLLFLVIGGAVAVGASESLRTKVLDTLFGAEEEFQYTPPASTPPAPAAAPVSAA